jgi:YidC/Oxa1 family membrane protein insertase
LIFYRHTGKVYTKSALKKLPLRPQEIMDRNSIIGLTLIFLIIIGTIYINQPTVEELEKRKREQDSISLVLKQQALDSVRQSALVTNALPDSLRRKEDSISRTGRFGHFAALTVGKEEKVVIENDLIKLTLSTRGGVPYAAELKPFKRALKEGETEAKPLLLFEGDEHRLDYVFALQGGRQVSTSELFFEPSQTHVQVGGDSSVLSLVARISDQVYLEQRYTMKPGSYHVGYEVITSGFDQVLAANTRYLAMSWSLDMPVQEKTVKAERDKSSVYYAFTSGDFDYIGPTKSGEETLKEGAIGWVSFKQQFFNSTLVCKDASGLSGVVVGSGLSPDEEHVKGLYMSTYLDHDFSPYKVYSLGFFFGPNHYQTLKAENIGLERLVPLGWGIFGWVNRFIVIPVFNFLNDYISSFGIIILMLTIIFKVLLFPLVYRSYISTAKMRVLKPEMDEIKEKYASDPQKMQTENMKLFRKAGVSPLGGCVPMLLQMPILFALFNFFPVSFELRQQPFLWAEDLSTYDSIWTFGQIPVIDFIYGDHVSLFTLLMTISTIIYTRLNNQISGISGQMKYIGYIMPVVFLGFFNNYAAGLSYYYFLSNVITFGQQFAIRKFVDEDKIHKQIQENKKKPMKKSRFQERLEQMAKQQQQARTVRKK